MGKFHINAASRIEGQLLQHTRFLSNVSIKAARRFRDEYAETLRSIRDNPYQFPFDTDRKITYFETVATREVAAVSGFIKRLAAAPFSRRTAR